MTYNHHDFILYNNFFSQQKKCGGGDNYEVLVLDHDC